MQHAVLTAEHDLIDWPVEGRAGRKPGKVVRETPGTPGTRRRRAEHQERGEETPGNLADEQACPPLSSDKPEEAPQEPSATQSALRPAACYPLLLLPQARSDWRIRRYGGGARLDAPPGMVANEGQRMPTGTSPPGHERRST